MNEPSSASRTPFIIILILLLAITGVQYFFNFNGLGTDAAMDHAQIARNVARGQGMTTNWLRPIQMVSGSTRAGLNPFLSDAQIHEQEAIRAGQGETLVDPEKFNPYALRDTRNAPLNILTEAAVFRMAGVHKFDLWSMTGSSMIYLPDRIVAGISCMFFILSVLSCNTEIIKNLIKEYPADKICILSTHDSRLFDLTHEIIDFNLSVSL